MKTKATKTKDWKKRFKKEFGQLSSAVIEIRRRRDDKFFDVTIRPDVNKLVFRFIEILLSEERIRGRIEENKDWIEEMEEQMEVKSDVDMIYWQQFKNRIKQLNKYLSKSKK